MGHSFLPINQLEERVNGLSLQLARKIIYSGPGLTVIISGAEECKKTPVLRAKGCL